MTNMNNTNQNTFVHEDTYQKIYVNHNEFDTKAYEVMGLNPNTTFMQISNEERYLILFIRLKSLYSIRQELLNEHSKMIVTNFDEVDISQQINIQHLDIVVEQIEYVNNLINIITYDMEQLNSPF